MLTAILGEQTARSFRSLLLIMQNWLPPSVPSWPVQSPISILENTPSPVGVLSSSSVSPSRPVETIMLQRCTPVDGSLVWVSVLCQCWSPCTMPSSLLQESEVPWSLYNNWLLLLVFLFLTGSPMEPTASHHKFTFGRN